MLRQSITVPLCVLCLAAIGPAQDQDPHKDQHEHQGHTAGEMNRTFQDPNLDVSKFVERFESESRDIFAQRRAIVEAAGVQPGMAVADIGAGTGLFTWLFAERVGPTGKVFPVEIAPAFLKHLSEQAAQRGLDRVVQPVRGGADATNLPAGSIDVAFVCATYHHFEHPARNLASIHRALRPNGRLVVIDFDLRPDSGEFVRHHARAPKETYFDEIRAAGFQLMDPQPSVALKDNFLAVFQRTAATPRPTPQH